MVYQLLSNCLINFGLKNELNWLVQNCKWLIFLLLLLLLSSLQLYFTFEQNFQISGVLFFNKCYSHEKWSFILNWYAQYSEQHLPFTTDSKVYNIFFAVTVAFLLFRVAILVDGIWAQILKKFEFRPHECFVDRPISAIFDWNIRLLKFIISCQKVFDR